MYKLRVVLGESEYYWDLESTCIIGRHSSANIVLPKKFISRYHCTLVLMPPDDSVSIPYYLIRDGQLLGDRSQNGTWVNKNPVVQATLKHQDIITFAQGQLFPQVIFLGDEGNYEGTDKDTTPHERETF